MPYVVPTSPAGASPGSPFGSSSTTDVPSTSPPIPLSISLSAPVPVPNFVPFLPSSPTRRTDSESPIATSYPLGPSNRNINMNSVFSRRTTPLLKSLSDMSPSMINSPPSQASSSPSPRSTPSNSPSPRLTRRSASASSADSSPLATRPRHHQRSSQGEFGSFDLGRFDNSAGRGLTHIPRRVASSNSGSLVIASGSSANLNDGADAKGTSTKRKSRFVLGSEESGSDADKEIKEKEKKEKEMEEREARKRPVSAERVRSLTSTEPIEAIVSGDDGLVFEMVLAETTGSSSPKKRTLKLRRDAQEESESDCATPTPVSIVRERESNRGRRGREKVLESSNTSKLVNGKTKEIRRRSGLSAEAAVETSHSEEQSSVAFPSSSPPGGSPPMTAQANQPRSFSSKRSNAGLLRIDLPKTNSHPISLASASEDVTAIDIPSGKGEGHHSRLLLSRTNYSPPACNVEMVPMVQVASTRSLPVPSAGGALRASASTSMVPLIRKKSGEVLKSSLKRRSSSASGASREGIPSFSLNDLSRMQVLSPSLSAPATPSAMDDDAGSVPKMVHFDAQLEHVKLFLAEQKPAAVSRNGSPTMDGDTTSGGESGTEWDAFNYGGAGGYFNPRRKRLTDGASSEEEAAVRKVLVMRVLNMPNRDAKSNSGSTFGVHPSDTRTEEMPGSGEVWLEGLYLADDASCVKGTVRVRNIAFEKSVVVRFTFDGWQTTSEVSARWVQSCSPPPQTPSLGSEPELASELPTIPAASMTNAIDRPSYDRFEFAISLSDLLLRIDEKTLVLAVKYCSAGREMWDNNSGQNYRAVFEKRVPGKNALSLVGTAVVTPGSGPGSGGLDGSGNKDGKDGKDGGGRDNALGLSLQGALERIASNGKGGGARDSDVSSSGSGSSSTKKTSDSLASRYDLGASLKNRASWRLNMERAAKWVPPSPQSAPAFVKSQSTVPWPAKKSASQIDGLPQTWGNVKFPMFASHKLNFGTRAEGLARGSPRDPDLDNLSDEALSKYQMRAFGISNAEERNVALAPSSQRRASNISSASNTSTNPGVGSDVFGPLAHKQNVRNHHRSYFDAWAANYIGGNGKTRFTPPGIPHRSLSDAELTAAIGSGASSRASTPVSELPVGAVSPGRFHSFPPLIATPPSPGATIVQQHPATRPWTNLSVAGGSGFQGLGLGVTNVSQTGSEVSTPSITSVSSPILTPSPASPPDFAMLGPMVAPSFTTSPTGEGTGENGLIDSDSYSLFLNRFCFYTGRDALLDIPPDMRRSHSASSVEEFLSSPSSVSTEAFPLLKGPSQTTPNISFSPRAVTPPRSANFSDSRTSTPTPASLLKSESPLSTSVHG